MKKQLSLILSALMLTSALAACGGESGSPAAGGTSAPQNGGQEIAQTEETEPSRENTPDNLPSDLDFGGGTVNIIYMGSEDSTHFDAVGEASGDIVYDAVYNRNVSVEERLNVKLNWIAGNGDWEGYPSDIKKAMTAGVSDYDIVMMENSRLFEQSLSGYWLDLIDAEYIDYDQPWWYSAMMSDGAIDNNHRYFITGDIGLTTLMGASAIYFNKGMFENYFGDYNALYTTVTDGKWTHDVLAEYCRAVYNDLDGDSSVNANDQFGFAYPQWGVPNYLSMSTGLSFITRDSDGLPVLDMNNEMSIKWAETLAKLLYTDNMAWDTTGGDDQHIMFKKNQTLFNIGMLSTANSLRDITFEYGLIPHPKLTESLDYMSGAGVVNGEGAAIPVSALTDNLERSCAVLEALCAESYRTVAPTWYETALKIKYVATDIDAQMVDLIYFRITGPFIMMADKAIGIGSIFTNVCYGSNGKADFASYWAKNEKSIMKKWDKMIASYLEISG